MLPARLLVMRSPSIGMASSATQAGMVNSSENTVANGSSVTASVHRKVPTKWMLLRARCRPMRLKASSLRSSALAAIRINRTIRPKPERIDRISNVVRYWDRARTATALAEKESSAPVIQSTTRPSFCCATG